MILIADSHVSKKNDNIADFFSMLDCIAKSHHDIIFLGDIFDLWISIPRYQSEEQIRFLDWCITEKQNRTVGFIEGNRDFFVKDYHSDHFTWCEIGSHAINFNNKKKLMFCHGDGINTKDIRCQFLRKSTKCLFTKFVLKYIPLGPFIAKKLNELTRFKYKGNKRKFPQKTIEKFATSIFKAKMINHIFTGHFHKNYEYTNNGNSINVITDWWKTGDVMIINDDGTTQISNWKILNNDI